MATVAGVAALMGPVGQVAAAIIAVIGAVLQVLLEILPLARGDGDCPVLGFRRTIPDGDCAAPAPQGNPTFAAAIRRYHDVALTGRADGGASGDVSGESDREETAGGSGLLLWGLGAAAVGALALVGVAAARKRRGGRVRGSRPTERSMPERSTREEREEREEDEDDFDDEEDFEGDERELDEDFEDDERESA